MGFKNFRFQKGQAERNDARRSGRPITTAAATQQLFQRADELIRNDQRLTIRNFATELSVSKERVSKVINALLTYLLTYSMEQSPS